MDNIPFFSNYFGIDWLAASCGLLGMYLLGNRKRHGFLACMAGAILGLAFAYLAQSGSLLLMNGLMIVMHIRGYLKWKIKNP